MMQSLRPICAFVLIVCFSFSVLYPGEAWGGFFDEDTLKTTGIIIGITFGVCLVVVLIAGTMKDLEGDPEDMFAELHLQPLPEGWRDPVRFFGIVPEPLSVPSCNGTELFRYKTLLAREEQHGEAAPGLSPLLRFRPTALLPEDVSGLDRSMDPAR